MFLDVNTGFFDTLSCDVFSTAIRGCRANRKSVTKPLPARRKMDDDEQATTVGAVGDEKCDVESAAFFQQLKTDALSALFDFDLPAQWRTQWAYDCDAAASSVDTQIPPLAKVMWAGQEEQRAADETSFQQTDAERKAMDYLRSKNSDAEVSETQFLLVDAQLVDLYLQEIRRIQKLSAGPAMQLQALRVLIRFANMVRGDLKMWEGKQPACVRLYWQRMVRAYGARQVFTTVEEQLLGAHERGSYELVNLGPFGRRRSPVDIFGAPVLAQLDTRVWETLRLWKPGKWDHVDFACPLALEGGVDFGLLAPAGGTYKVSAENARPVVLHVIPTSPRPDALRGISGSPTEKLRLLDGLLCQRLLAAAMTYAENDVAPPRIGGGENNKCDGLYTWYIEEFSGDAVDPKYLQHWNQRLHLCPDWQSITDLAKKLADLTTRLHRTPIDRVASIDGQIDGLLQDIDILALNADDQITDEFVAMSRLGCVDRESLLWSLLEGGLVLEMARPRWIEAGSHADKNEITIERGKVCRDASHGRLWKRDGQGQLWIDESSKSWESYVNAAKHWQKEAKSIFSTNLVVMHGDYHWGNIVVDMQDDDSDLVSGARTWKLRAIDFENSTTGPAVSDLLEVVWMMYRWQKEGPLSGQPHAADTGECLARLFLSEYVKAMKFMHDPDDDEITELLIDVLLAQLWGKCRAPDFPMDPREPERMICLPGLNNLFIKSLRCFEDEGSLQDHIEFVKQFHDDVRTCKDLRDRLCKSGTADVLFESWLKKYHGV